MTLARLGLGRMGPCTLTACVGSADILPSPSRVTGTSFHVFLLGKGGG
jgi:hypothetical protein